MSNLGAMVTEMCMIIFPPKRTKVDFMKNLSLSRVLKYA